MPKALIGRRKITSRPNRFLRLIVACWVEIDLAKNRARQFDIFGGRVPFIFAGRQRAGAAVVTPYHSIDLKDFGFTQIRSQLRICPFRTPYKKLSGALFEAEGVLVRC